MIAVYTLLESDEAMALVRLALREKRTPRDQAAYLIRQSLEHLGLLPPGPITPAKTIPPVEETAQCKKP